jgi:hypothetical protein
MADIFLEQLEMALSGKNMTVKSLSSPLITIHQMAEKDIDGNYSN